MTDEIKQITFKKELEIVISVQALKILAGTKYSLEEFEKWALIDQKISLGGNNVSIFLEQMYNRKTVDSETSKPTEVNKDVSTISD